MLARLVLNSWPQVIHLPQPPKVQGLKAQGTTASQLQLTLHYSVYVFAEISYQLALVFHLFQDIL